MERIACQVYLTSLLESGGQTGYVDRDPRDNTNRFHFKSRAALNVKRRKDFTLRRLTILSDFFRIEGTRPI